MDPKSFYGLSTKFISKIPNDGNAIADALCKAGKTVTPKRGRPSNRLQQKIDAKKKRGPAAELPQAEVRQDGFCHYPIWRDTWKMQTT